MACLHPIKIKNRRYEKFDVLKLNNYCVKVIGVEHCIPSFRGRTISTTEDPFDGFSYHDCYTYLPPDFYIYVPCGRCVECKKTKRLQWAFRLITECRSHLHNTFITLTIAPKYYKDIYNNPRKYLKLFIDRLRKRLGYRPKYFIVPEIGQDDRYTHRLHFHGIIFNTPKDMLPYKTIQDTWNYGRTDTGYCNDKTCNYVVKYILKDYKKDLGVDFKPFVHCSNGIGLSYLDKKDVVSWHINGFDFRDYCKIGDVVYPMSPYYRDKVYSDDVKVVKMVNRIWDVVPWFEKSFHGRTFTSPFDYYQAVASYYRWTLKQGLSDPLPKLKNYGCFDVSDFDRVDFINVKQNDLWQTMYFRK